MSATTLDRIINLLRDVCAAERIKLPAKVNGSTNLSDLGLNSLLFIKFVVKLEVEFDIDFDDENMDVKNFVTVNDVVQYVEQQLSAQ